MEHTASKAPLQLLQKQ